MGTNAEAVSPYVGPRPFELADSAYFFGRDKEVPRIVTGILANRAFVLYAQSGAGKTSILNTRVLPLLDENDFEVFPNYDPQDKTTRFSPIARVSGTLPEGMSLQDVDNIFVFNALYSWTKNDEDVKRLTRITLAEYLAEHKHLLNDEGSPKQRVIIFDQFEELFTCYPQFWEKHAPFFEQIKTAMRNDNGLWVLFSLREDFIARFDKYTQYFEDRLRGRFRLEPLRAEAALQAIREPLSKLDIRFDDGVAEKIVQDLLQERTTSVTGDSILAPGEFAEPVYLQIICQTLWKNLPVDTKIITQDYVERLGGINRTLTTFYEQCLRDAIRGTGVSERQMRNWFERYMITPMGTRGNISQGKEKTGDIPNSIVVALENVHLLRSELRAGARWFELAHDRIVDPIHASNKEWFARRTRRLVPLAFGACLTIIVIISAAFYNVNNQNTVNTNLLTQVVAVAGTVQAETVSSNETWTPKTKDFAWGEMVQVPPGCLRMGSFDIDNAQPVKKYCITQRFWIDPTEVSNAQFAVSGKAAQNCSAPVSGDPQQPRACVTWQEAESYCQSRDPNARLPSEAEWEYAARGPDALTYPWGAKFPSDSALSLGFVVYQGNARLLMPLDVGGRPKGASWVGAQDMSGNVAEWTHTIYDSEIYPYPYDPTDGREAETNAAQRIIRGGSFASSESDLFAAARSGAAADTPSLEIGFRCIVNE